MNYYAVSALINFFTSIFIASLVFKKTDKKNIISKTFFLFALAVATWSLSYFIWQVSSSRYLAETFSRALLLPAIWIPSIFFHFIIALTDKKNSLNKPILINYGISLFFSISLPFKFFISGTSATFGFQFWPVAGPFFAFFLLYFLGVAISAHCILWRAITGSSDPKKRTQLKYVFFGTMVGFIGGSTNYFLFYSIPVKPYGNILVSFYVAMVGYSIIKHNLLDIEIIIKKTAVFAGLFAFTYGTFATITVLGQEFFRNSLHWNQWIAMIPTVGVITFALRPLEVFLTNATEKFLFQKKYDYKDLLKVFTNEILSVIDLQKLTQDTVKSLLSIIKLESAAVLVHDRATKTYNMVSSINVKEKEIVLQEDSLLIQYLKKTNGPIQADRSVEKMETGELKESFKKLNARICLPLELQDELIGVLSLGTKKSGEEYT